jgi:hypothetical protein
MSVASLLFVTFFGINVILFLILLLLICIGTFVKRMQVNRNKEYEHAAVLQMATRRKLSNRSHNFIPKPKRQLSIDTDLSSSSEELDKTPTAPRPIINDENKNKLE